MKCPFLFLLVFPVLSLLCLILMWPLRLSLSYYLYDIFFLHLVSNSGSKVYLLGEKNKQTKIWIFFFQSENYCLFIRVFSLFTFNIIVNIGGFMSAILLFVLICLLYFIVPSLLIYSKWFFLYLLNPFAILKIIYFCIFLVLNQELHLGVITAYWWFCVCVCVCYAADKI